jgi:hypothetical protein
MGMEANKGKRVNWQQEEEKEGITPKILDVRKDSKRFFIIKG